MQEDMGHCRKKELGRLEEVECCFHMAERFWALLRADLSGHVFDRIDDEIKFFKYTKPKFTSEVEYYSLLYHAELFRKDVHDAVDLRHFWTREKRRLKKFIAENEVFYQYYKEGKCEFDELYFVRSNSDLSNFPKAKVYDLEEKAATSHDSLVTMILALERYTMFIEEEMRVLHGE